MRQSRFSEEEIVNILKEGQSTSKLDDVLKKYSISRGTYYKWQSSYGGLEVTALKRLKQLETKNRKLKEMYVKACLEKTILQEAIAGKL